MKRSLLILTILALSLCVAGAASVAGTAVPKNSTLQPPGNTDDATIIMNLLENLKLVGWTNTEKPKIFFNTWFENNGINGRVTGAIIYQKDKQKIRIEIHKKYGSTIEKDGIKNRLAKTATATKINGYNALEAWRHQKNYGIIHLDIANNLSLSIVGNVENIDILKSLAKNINIEKIIRELR
jgi:hypothetical protein